MFQHDANEIISIEDLIQLTGYKIPSKQCESLHSAGIFFITRRDGRPQTTWGHFQNPLSFRHLNPIKETAAPNFGALN
ncbi:DUF4224 domain-containing protein [Candidatus Fukatsuia symbiotica]|uniref:DUF4224 domain-containing protein n=1 Tax=Candidatus Fukatsuia symbiotica TaxID=1878942 RepID=A0A2U8I3P5_9GAMM|nr:DUF4224 domain-containing protein [Candidatus Fukatsuia symbiotica]AWK13609.1 hypothetical protein CCS41_02390 [Candidatus Fukatsuia symbiotica]AWK13741.1 hypothetical protein CCS41_03415 [Candidatus Fukatsuia symbiotica]MEA9445419.1 DUF4224 domain-containing protein [Candidatus Fukatsuia symbiotica]MEA9445583.1 DUF4224 domain-containing protein [Candidatus Fukatsuia symbiotica]